MISVEKCANCDKRVSFVCDKLLFLLLLSEFSLCFWLLRMWFNMSHEDLCIVSLFGVLCTSWMGMFILLIRFREFSFTISLNKLSSSFFFSFSALSVISTVYILAHSTVFHNSYKHFSFFFPSVPQMEQFQITCLQTTHFSLCLIESTVELFQEIFVFDHCIP